jgi:glucose-6-phosphate isomerase
MSLTYAPAAELSDRLLHERVIQRIWERDCSVWGANPDSADARSIASRLGWLDAPAGMSAELDRVLRLGAAAAEEGIQAVYLLGMGGSSLCAEVIRTVYGVANGHPELLVLDTTDEHTISQAAARMDPARTWFLVASKSGGTVEVASLERFFWSSVTSALGERADRQFVAITDPGTALEQLARSRGYREIFLNPADIGGRFSAISLFHANAGLELGAFIATAAINGRDKLTVVLPPSLASLGLWIEQLVAESTGKHGKGALPVVDETLGRIDVYGNDRAFVAVSTDHDAPDAAALQALQDAGHPLLRLTTRLDGLGAEFFRWEFATAIAGAGLAINPFDEPNVAEAKEKTKALLAAYAQQGRLPEPDATADGPSTSVYSNTFNGDSPAAVVRAAVDSLTPRDYAAFLSYLPADSGLSSAMNDVRTELRSRRGVATTFGIGPRYLHSTGQYHKGGPNTVVAFVVTGDDEAQTAIPEAGYSFSVLKRAQALGDMQTLEAHGRRAVRIHVRGPWSQAASRLAELFEQALR